MQILSHSSASFLRIAGRESPEESWQCHSLRWGTSILQRTPERLLPPQICARGEVLPARGSETERVVCVCVCRREGEKTGLAIIKRVPETPGDGENNWSWTKVMVINCPLLSACNVLSFPPSLWCFDPLFGSFTLLHWSYYRIFETKLASLPLISTIGLHSSYSLHTVLHSHIHFPHFFVYIQFYHISSHFSTWVKPMLCSNTHYSLSLFPYFALFNWSCRIFVSRMTTKKSKQNKTH